MKRIYYLTLLLPLFLISCESTPEAAFYVDNIEPEVGQEVLFTNNSANAERFEWDFGDNTWTDEPSPIHVYTGTGLSDKNNCVSIFLLVFLGNLA